MGRFKHLLSVGGCQSGRWPLTVQRRVARCFSNARQLRGEQQRAFAKLAAGCWGTSGGQLIFSPFAH
jgi:hypothetical protein